MTDAKKEREKGRPADYGEATPEQVGEALLKYRRPVEAGAKPPPPAPASRLP